MSAHTRFLFARACAIKHYISHDGDEIEQVARLTCGGDVQQAELILATPVEKIEETLSLADLDWYEALVERCRKRISARKTS